MRTASLSCRENTDRFFALRIATIACSRHLLVFYTSKKLVTYMTTEKMATPHHRRNVKRIREMLGIKQEAMAIDLGISQQAISALE